MKYQTRRASCRAFTLFELLLVLIVLAALAGILLPKFTDQGQSSQDAALQRDLNQLRDAISLYYSDTGLYPEQLSDLASPMAPSYGVTPPAGSSPALHYIGIGATPSGSSDPFSGTPIALASGSWHGPYIKGSVPRDPISGRPFNYSASSGAVHSSMPLGTKDATGSPYSNY